MRLKNYSKHLLKPTLLCAVLSIAQTSPLLNISPPAQLVIKKGGTARVKVTASLNEGFHLNSNTPPEDYLIPLSLKWVPGSVEAGDVIYPKAQQLKVPFDPKPLSVLTGKFEITTTFKTSATATVGPSTVTGKLRYQACNDKSCFPPKTLEVKLPVEVQ
jgi:thiol:disulfide interchange protein DsbD